MTADELEMKRLLDLTERARIDLLYESFYSGSLSSDDSDGAARKAAELYRTLERQARRIVCESKTINELVVQLDKGGITLGLLLCDALATMLQKPAAFILAAQIASLGIKQFCQREG